MRNRRQKHLPVAGFGNAAIDAQECDAALLQRVAQDAQHDLACTHRPLVSCMSLA